MRGPHSTIYALTLVLLGLLAVPVLALAGPAGPGPRQGLPDPELRIERMAERLDLTLEQQQQIESLVTDHRESNQAVHEAVRQARRVLREQTHAEPFDEQAIRDAAAELSRIETELIVARGVLLHEFRTVLTTEQQEEFDELLQQRHERMERRRQRFTESGSGFGFGHSAPRRGRR